MANLFVDAMLGKRPEKLVCSTENGAISLPTTQPPHQIEQNGGRTDLFFKTVRGLKTEDLFRYLNVAWQENPLDTLKIIFQTRDCRGGKGERKLFADMLTWLHTNHHQSFVDNLHLVPLYGRWDNVLPFPEGIDFMARQLIKDKKELDEKKEQAQISMAAKWAPSEGHALDKKYSLVSKLVKAMGMVDDPVQGITYGRSEYRKKYITPLRRHLKIVEQRMCAKQWETIEYSHVPSKAMKNYKNAFLKHDPVRFGTWTKALQREDKKTEDGDVVKVNAKQLFPHELVREYLNGGRANVVTEEQWKVLENETKSSGNFEHSLCLCDVSGSMAGEPMEASIALGLLISGVTAEPFKNCILTFESVPNFHQVQGVTLQEKVQNVSNMEWGGSTNLQAAFDLILTRALQFKVSAQAMPKRLYIFSDMQFDQACSSNFYTNYEELVAKYRASGYDLPEVVFWNLRASETKEFPVTSDQKGVALLSGFSPSLIKAVLDGADLSPWGIIRKILDDPRYSAVTYSQSDYELC